MNIICSYQAYEVLNIWFWWTVFLLFIRFTSAQAMLSDFHLSRFTSHLADMDCEGPIPVKCSVSYEPSGWAAPPLKACNEPQDPYCHSYLEDCPFRSINEADTKRPFKEGKNDPPQAFAEDLKTEAINDGAFFFCFVGCTTQDSDEDFDDDFLTHTHSINLDSQKFEEQGEHPV